jgi:hypothetical protein
VDLVVQTVLVEEERLGQFGGLAAVLLLDRLPHRADVAAGAERLLALALDHHGADGVVMLPVVELGRHLPDHAMGQGVQRLGPRQLDRRQAAIGGKLDLVTQSRLRVVSWPAACGR